MDVLDQNPIFLLMDIYLALFVSFMVTWRLASCCYSKNKADAGLIRMCSKLCAKDHVLITEGVSQPLSDFEMDKILQNELRKKKHGILVQNTHNSLSTTLEKLFIFLWIFFENLIHFDNYLKMTGKFLTIFLPWFSVLI